MSSAIETLNHIKIAALSIDFGRTGRMDCPECKGHNSVAITKTTDKLIYICHRAGCDLQGHLYGAVQKIESAKPVTKGDPPYAGKLVRISVPMHELYFEKYQVPKYILEKQGIRYALTEKRIYVPLYNEWGALHGYQLRTPVKEVKPKVISRKFFREQPLFHCPTVLSEMPRHLKNLILVEDYLSAIKIQYLGWPAISLEGTHLSRDFVYKLKAICKSYDYKVGVMLDGDAQVKADNLVRAHMGYLDMFRIPLSMGPLNNPKDIDLSTLELLLESYEEWKH